MHQPTISALQRHAWQIVDKYDLRFDNHFLQISMSIIDCQDQAHGNEALITITYRRPFPCTDITASATDHFSPNLALLEFERSVSLAAARLNSITNLIP